MDCTGLGHSWPAQAMAEAVHHKHEQSKFKLVALEWCLSINNSKGSTGCEKIVLSGLVIAIFILA